MEEAGLFTQLKGEIINGAVDWAAGAFPGAGIVGEGGIFIMDEAAGSYILNVAGNSLASALSVVGTVFAVYNLVMMIIKLIYACEPSETKLSINRQMKLCHYVGDYCSSKFLGICLEKKKSYCCYTSMLSRVMNEQVRGQLGTGFGEPENPSCGGISTDEMSAVDMERVDLSEWIQSLNLAGVMTTSAVEAQARYSQTNVLHGVSATRTTVTATPDARFKALYRTGTDAGAVDAQRNAITQEANKALTAGALPTIHGNQ